MRVVLTLLMSVVLSACSACVHSNGPFFVTDDMDAREMQNIFRSTVKVWMTFTPEKSVPTSSKALEPDGGTEDLVDHSMHIAGTGVVVEVFAGKSLILTAGHVAHMDPEKDFGDIEGNPAKIAKSVQEVITLEGVICPAHEVYFNKDADLGVILADCVAGIPAKMADDLPPYGAKIQTAGAPGGYHSYLSYAAYDGRFSGMTFNDRFDLVYSIPIGRGQSGSGVFYHGKLFGLISSVSQSFADFGYGPPYWLFRKALDEARETAWPNQ